MQSGFLDEQRQWRLWKKKIRGRQGESEGARAKGRREKQEKKTESRHITSDDLLRVFSLVCVCHEDGSGDGRVTEERGAEETTRRQTGSQSGTLVVAVAAVASVHSLLPSRSPLFTVGTGSR